MEMAENYWMSNRNHLGEGIPRGPLAKKSAIFRGRTWAVPRSPAISHRGVSSAAKRLQPRESPRQIAREFGTSPDAAVSEASDSNGESASHACRRSGELAFLSGILSRGVNHFRAPYKEKRTFSYMHRRTKRFRHVRGDL